MELGRSEHGLPPQSNDMKSLSLSVCLYWLEKFCVQGLALSVCMYVMIFQDKHILTKWNILSNCLLVHSRERIFHFGRVCWSWKTITYIRAERARPWTQNFSGQYIRASKPQIYKIKFYILRQNQCQTCFNDFPMSNGAWNKLQFKVCQVAQASVTYLDKHSTLDPVMVSVVSSMPTGRRQLFAKIFYTLWCKFRLNMEMWSYREKLEWVLNKDL